MKIIEYNQADSYALVREVKKVIDLSDEEDGELQRRLKKYRIVLPVENDIKSRSILMRMTLPLFVLVFILFVILLCPIKWIITGHFGFYSDRPVGRLMCKWSDLLEINS